MTPAQRAKIPGYCVRKVEAECGMKDPRKCRVHAGLQLGEPERRELEATWGVLSTH